MTFAIAKKVSLEILALLVQINCSFIPNFISKFTISLRTFRK